MTRLPDWRFILAKHILNRRWENGFVTTFNLIFDRTEDFGRNLLLKPGGELFIDGGANAGMWTLQASRVYSQVIAIEPTLKSVKTLNQNLAMNKIRNVKVIRAALSERVGVARFYEWSDGSMGNSLLEEPVNYTSDYGHGKEQGLVDTITIDSLNIHPDAIKLDVEGAELAAIEGGLGTIRRSKPRLFVEIHRTENMKRIREMLPEYDWQERKRWIEPEGKTGFYQSFLLGNAGVDQIAVM